MEKISIDGIFCKQILNNLKTMTIQTSKPSYTVGSILQLAFDNEPIRNHYIYVKSIRKTTIYNLTNTDINKLGFLYDKHLHRYLNNKMPRLDYADNIYKVEFICFTEEEAER